MLITAVTACSSGAVSAFTASSSAAVTIARACSSTAVTACRITVVNAVTASSITKLLFLLLLQLLLYLLLLLLLLLLCKHPVHNLFLITSLSIIKYKYYTIIRKLVNDEKHKVTMSLLYFIIFYCN